MECIICKRLLKPRNALRKVRKSDFGKETVRTQCGHIYHRDCIVKWLRGKGFGLGVKNLCPTCFKPIQRQYLSRVILPSASSAAENGLTIRHTTGPCIICDKLRQEIQELTEEISRDNAATVEKTREVDKLESEARALNKKNNQLVINIKKMEAEIKQLEGPFTSQSQGFYNIFSGR